jgi:hypothetical protein
MTASSVPPRSVSSQGRSSVRLIARYLPNGARNDAGGVDGEPPGSGQESGSSGRCQGFPRWPCPHEQRPRTATFITAPKPWRRPGLVLSPRAGCLACGRLGRVTSRWECESGTPRPVEYALTSVARLAAIIVNGASRPGTSYLPSEAGSRVTATSGAEGSGGRSVCRSGWAAS